MSLREYFSVRDGLPDPRGPLSAHLSSQAISLANKEVEKALDLEKEKKKRGHYTRYDSKTRADIGRFAHNRGTKAAALTFSQRLGTKLCVSTVHSMKKAYLAELKEKQKDDPDAEITSLSPKKRGRPLLLAELDDKVQMYLRKIREGGGVVTASIVVAAARGILISTDRSRLAEFGGHIHLNKDWAYSLLNRMKFVRRKVSTAKSKYNPVDFAQVKADFLSEVVTTVSMEEIPPELILNWDQTGIKLVPSSAWTMDTRGAKRVEIAGANDKRLITAVFCGSMVGEFLPVQVIYKGTTHRCHPHFKFPDDWDITHSKKHWSTEETMIQYIKNIIVPYVQCKRKNLGEDKAALVIIDNFKGQITPKNFSLLEEHNIHVCLLPANSTDVLQPMDISVNKPAKSFLNKKFEHWYSSEITKQVQGKDIESVVLQPINLSLAVVKEHSARWLVEMADFISDNPLFIVNGFIRAGISRALDGFLYDCYISSEEDELSSGETSEEVSSSEEELSSEEEMSSEEESSSEDKSEEEPFSAIFD